MKSPLEEIAEERVRQQAVKGYDASHDDDYDPGELTAAAACYALNAANLLTPYNGLHIKRMPDEWPWEDGWKPSTDNPRKDLIKAGALIVAELDKLNRAAASQQKVA